MHYASRSYRQKLIKLQRLATRDLQQMGRLPMPAPKSAGETETTKQCHKCGEWWPATKEFFYSMPRRPDKLRSPCKACIDEQRAASSKTRPCAYPGCDQTRYHWRASYCYEHRYHARKKKV